MSKPLKKYKMEKLMFKNVESLCILPDKRGMDIIIYDWWVANILRINFCKLSIKFKIILWQYDYQLVDRS